MNSNERSEKSKQLGFYLEIAGEMEAVHRSIKWENVISCIRYCLFFLVVKECFVQFSCRNDTHLRSTR